MSGLSRPYLRIVRAGALPKAQQRMLAVPCRPGACIESQADGVPCEALGRRCEQCPRGLQPSEREAW